MIGQITLQNAFKSMYDAGTLPRFIILVGDKGSGKKELIKEVFDNYIFMNTKVDAVRTMIDLAYKVHTTTFYILADADNMSLAAKNALLKLTEEPPNNAYVIMTLQNTDNTLPTIRSRAAMFHMSRYSKKELAMYWDDNYDIDTYKDIMLDLCETPGEIDTLLQHEPQQFYEYVELVLDNIADVTQANAFKIAERVSFKEEDTQRYDLVLFWKAFANLCIKRCTIGQEDSSKYLTWTLITNNALKVSTVKAVNKQMLFDVWLMDIRKVG